MNGGTNDSVDHRQIVRRNTQSSASTDVEENENTEQLPIDLIIEILSRLPAKSIAICSCVSKQWSSLLRRPYFTKLFLTRSSSRPRLLFIFRCGDKLHFFLSPQPDQHVSVVVATDYYMRYSVDNIEICQSINGFISMGDGNRCVYKFPVINNPCTGQHITLPEVGVIGIYPKSFFGYDPIEKQYKVVLSMTVACNENEVTPNEYHVLTLGTAELSWRKIECSFPHYPYRKGHGICINGVLYYLVWTNNSKTTIVCFDVRLEKFRFINIEREEASLVTLINYKGKLGVFVLLDRGGLDDELWVLDDTNKVKWSKHLFVSPYTSFETIRSMWATDTGEIVWAPCRLTHPMYVYYYNLERQSVRRVEVKGMEDKVSSMGHEGFFTLRNHVENLMFL